MSAKVSAWSFNLLVAAFLLAGFVLYALIREDDDATKLRQLHALTEELRAARATARAALAAAAHHAGTVPLRRGKSIEYYATGPEDAEVVILLHAEDGDGAATWGSVHAAVAMALGHPVTTPAAAALDAITSAVSDAGRPAPTSAVAARYAQRLGAVVGADSPSVAPHPPQPMQLTPSTRTAAAVTAPPASPPSSAPAPPTWNAPRVRIITYGRTPVPDTPPCAGAVTLRMRDTATLLQHLYPGVMMEGEASPSRGGRRSSPRFVLVSHGEGVWGDLATMAINTPPSIRADTSTTPASSLARFQHPWAAIVAVTPMVLHRGAATVWLDAAIGASKVPSQTDPHRLTTLLQPVMHDTQPSIEVERLKQALLQRVSASRGGRPPTAEEEKAVDAAVQKQVAGMAAAIRERQAADAILSDFDTTVLLESAPVLGSKASAPLATHTVTDAPAIHAIVPHPTTLPQFVGDAGRISLSAWLLHAANAVGMLVASPTQRQAMAQARAAAIPDMLVEVTGRLPPEPPPPSMPSPTPALEPGSGDADTRGNILSIVAPASLLSFSMGGAVAGPGAAWLSTAPAGDWERTMYARIHRKLRRFVGLQPPIPPDQSFTVLYMLTEQARLPSNFCVTLAQPPSPTHPHGIIHLPLQQPHRVADAVLDATQPLLHGAPGAGMAAHPAA